MLVLVLASKPTWHSELSVGNLESPLLIPFKGKALIEKFEELSSHSKVVYAIPSNTEVLASLITAKFPNSDWIEVPQSISQMPVLNCLSYCIDQLNSPKEVMVLYGDNVYDFYDLPNENSSYIHYTFRVQEQNRNYTYYEKISPDKIGNSHSNDENDSHYVQTGAHYFHETSFILHHESPFDWLAERRMSDYVELKNWIDLGHADLTGRHNISLESRAFNKISMSLDNQSIVKTSNQSKLKREFEYLKNVPKKFELLFPRVRSASTEGSQSFEYSYEMEFWPLKSLSEYLVFWTLDKSSWRYVIHKLIDLVIDFKSVENVRQVTFETTEFVYLQMLEDRLASFPLEIELLMNKDEIRFNDTDLRGFYTLHHKFLAELRAIGSRLQPSFFHGDLCFTNILFSPEGGTIKLIDPKGSLFTESSNLGDFRYDLAKLYQSTVVSYDYLHWSMYSLNQHDDSFNLILFEPKASSDVELIFRNALEAHFSKELVRDVEVMCAMLFMTMIPMHSDSIERQKCMFLIGLNMLNRLYP